MSSVEQVKALNLLRRVASDSFFEHLCEVAQHRWHLGIYTPAMVVWLMILQRLHPKGTLSAAVQTVACHPEWPVLPRCQRVRDGRISSATGGYCQARQKLPKLVAVAVFERIAEQLQRQLASAGAPTPPVFLVDGSSLELRHERDLVQAFPPCQNPSGGGHWPLLKLLVLHDVHTGLALRPAWGPMYGPAAVSEQALLSRELPEAAVILADRNFGIFALAWGVLAAEPLGPDPASEAAGGAPTARAVITIAHPGEPGERLYLVTNTDRPAEEIVRLYGLRWNVETDLRALKQTVRLHQLSSQSVDMMEKELLLAMAAYNLVRAVMALAAQAATLAPRQLSFSRVQDAVYAYLPLLQAADSSPAYAQQVQKLLRVAAQCRLPQRTKRRSFPREVWSHGTTFPSRKRPR